MSTIADEVALYIYGAHVVQLTRMCQVAPYVAMLYDHLLTFDLEVEHIWKRQRSMSTVLYVVLRYVGGAYGLFSASGTECGWISMHPLILTSLVFALSITGAWIQQVAKEILLYNTPLIPFGLAPELGN
ncbi:hypothetical protein HYDPIDRAFT_27284 [Hydnomerulius pinastri MD-312]|nr:hypothetical protein HYDPIDRAFT_27284 [Hydnomerulius pinastri MD-312]